MSKQAAATPKKVKSPLEGFHPKQHNVNVVMTDGTKFKIMTTWGNPDQVLTLDVDPKNHPVWQEKSQNFVNANSERRTKFKNKFGDFDFMATEETK